MKGSLILLINVKAA